MDCIKCGTPLLSGVCSRCGWRDESGLAANTIVVLEEEPPIAPAVAASSFQIIFTGLHPDSVREEAIARLAALFKTTIEQVHVLLSVPEHILKAGLSADLAVRFQAAIKAAGGTSRIQVEKSRPLVVASQASEASATKASTTAPTTEAAASDARTAQGSPWVTYQRIDLPSATWEEAMPYYDAVIAGDLDDQDTSSASAHKKQERREKYLALFQEFHDKKKSFYSPNKCGIFFGAFWFAYRRMPVIAYGFLGLSFLLGMVAELYFGKRIDRIAFPLALVLGFTGNYLYFLSAKSRIQSVMSLPREQAIASLKKEGGTSASAVWMIVVMLLLYAFFVQPFFGGFIKGYSRAMDAKKTASSTAQKPSAQARLSISGETHRNPEEHLLPGQGEVLHNEELRQMAEQGNMQAQLLLGQRYAKGLGMPQDYREAAVWYRKAADQGSAQAQSILGLYYFKGQGVLQDYHESVAWLRKAAEQGDATAQYNLGVMYRKGYGVQRDDQEAMAWFRKAADQDNTKVKQMAQNNVGVVHSEGQGVPRDPQQAAEWYRKSAEQGHATSQTNLGQMYEAGEGVPKDYQQAMTWYMKAAQQNDANAQFRLGAMFERGLGTRPDDAKAFEWYNKAAAQGHAKAQYRLGVKYANGHGVHKDMVQALKWFILSAPTEPQAEQARVRAESEMSAQQIQQARDLASAVTGGATPPPTPG